jgi:hypothetical protein
MSTAARRWILCGLGVLAGLAAWPVTELALKYQSSFPSYLIFSLALGAVFGLILGAFFGSAAGITTYIRIRIIRGALAGAAVGLAGGAVGFLIGQAVLLLLGNVIFSSRRSLTMVGLPVARAVGWSVLGVFIGMADGIRVRSLKKILVGSLGGFIGGLLGGFLLEYSGVFFPSFSYARLGGCILLGLLIGLFYGIIERQLSCGVLRILNGPYKGKEYLVSQNRMTVGASSRSDISLSGYKKVGEIHAVITVKRKNVRLREKDTAFPVLVNEEKVKEHELKFEDVIKMGSARLYYRAE